jgi:hypothetical protein
MRDAPKNITLGRDFNCALDKSDSMVYYHHSPALAELVRCFTLKDFWLDEPSRKAFTHYSTSGATLDRIYLAQELLAKTLGVEALVPTFKDHLVICLRLTVDIPTLQRGRGLWKHSSIILTDIRCK